MGGRVSPRPGRATVDRSRLLSLYQGTPLVFKPFEEMTLGGGVLLFYDLSTLVFGVVGGGGMNA